MLKHLLPSFLFFFSLSLYAQTNWKGKVIDAHGEALPFVNVFFEGTSIGTTTNMNGEFSLNQPSAEKHFLLFQLVGFERKKLDLNQQTVGQNLKIALREQALDIKEVTIAAYKKRPRILRHKTGTKKTEIPPKSGKQLFLQNIHERHHPPGSQTG